MRILFIGDVVGRSGRTIVTERLPGLIADWKLDLVVVNGENAAGGFGITEAIYNELIDAGADVITLGNHAWDQREALVFIERAPRLIRPLNYPPGTPGRGAALIEAKNGARVWSSMPWAASSWTRSTIRSPRSSANSPPARSSPAPTPSSSISIARRPARSRRWAISPTAARASWSAPTPMCRPPTTRILPGGTAFMSDVGMTGDYDSVIGMDKDEPLNRFLRKLPGAKFEPANWPGDAVRPRGRDRRRDRPRAQGRARCGSAASWKRRGRSSGTESVRARAGLTRDGSIL